MAIHYIKAGIDANKLYETINSLTGASNTSGASESISYPNGSVKLDDDIWKGRDGRFLFFHRVVVDNSTSPATHIHVFVPGSKYVEALGAFLTSSSWVAGGSTSLIGTINLVNQIDPSVTNSFYVGNSYKSETTLKELFKNGISDFVTSTETTFADASSFKMIELEEVNLAGESLVDNLSPNAQNNQFIFTMWKQYNSKYCVNFNGGGGLSQQKLSKTTADPAAVLSGETFYSKNKDVKTGTLPHYPDQYKMASNVVLGDYLSYEIPRGGYTHTKPFIRAEKSQVAKKIGLTANKVAAGSTVLGVTGSAGGSIALILYAEYLPRGTGGHGSQTIDKTVGYYNPTYFDSSGKCVKAGTYHASYFAKCAAEGSGTISNAEAVVGNKTFTTTKNNVEVEQASNISLGVGATPTCQVFVEYSGTGSDNRAVAVLTVMAKV